MGTKCKRCGRPFTHWTDANDHECPGAPIDGATAGLLFMTDQQGLSLAEALRYANREIGFPTASYDAWQKRLKRARAEVRLRELSFRRRTPRGGS